MEILSKLMGVACGVCITLQVQAQSIAVMQNAYKSSYAQEARKNYAEAINDIKPFYSDNNYEANLRLGWLYYLSKNYPLSETYYVRAVKLKPNSVEARLGYVKPLSLLNKTDDVLAQYAAVLKLDPQNTQANYWTGIIYYYRKQYDAAIRYFTRVANLYPFDYDGNQMLGWSYLLGGNKGQARYYFEKALLIKPNDASCLEGLNKAK